MCGSSYLSRFGHKKKTVKHCTHFTFLYIVTCNIQRYKCKNCGYDFYEQDNFSFPNENLSIESVFQILDLLKMPNMTFESVAKSMHISRQVVRNVFNKYISYAAPSTLPKIICFDEKHVTKRMTENTYLFVMVDFTNNKIFDILNSRRKFVLINYFKKIPLEKRKQVEFITMDMWDTYKEVAELFFKNAKIAVDSFHVMRQVNKAMEKIRTIVMQKYNNKAEEIENNHDYYYMLKKFKYFFVKEFDDIFDKRIYIHKLKCYMNKYEIKKYLFSIDPRLTLAYHLTEKYREFNRTCRFENAKSELLELIKIFKDSKLRPFVDCARTLTNWMEYIVNSFIITDTNRRLSNGPCEGINAIIEKINFNGNGYWNFFSFRNRCAYVINKDVPISYKK